MKVRGVSLSELQMFMRLGRWAPWRGQRKISTTPMKRGGDDHHDEGGVPGKNLPFQITNRWRLALTMGVYMGSGFATPFLLLRHQLKKKN